MSCDNRMPLAPAGLKALRVHDGTQDLWAIGATRQITHLIVTQSQGTLCGLTLFDSDGRRADIPGWSVGGGVSGPNVQQIRCGECFAAASQPPIDTAPPAAVSPVAPVESTPPTPGATTNAGGGG